MKKSWKKKRSSKLPGVVRISTAKVVNMQGGMKAKWGYPYSPNMENFRHWYEGMEFTEIEKHSHEIKELYKTGNIRYWSLGDSYLLFDVTKLVPYRVFCITQDFFIKHLI